jgi:hypothetical protein
MRLPDNSFVAERRAVVDRLTTTQVAARYAAYRPNMEATRAAVEQRLKDLDWRGRWRRHSHDFKMIIKDF